ncbi:MAG: hypothetical protein ACRC33_18650 [Gemmataceae bacterium]
MTRKDWEALADDWSEDARVLLAAGRWGCAYYAAGYAVECALKVCVMARVAANPAIVFDEKTVPAQLRTHKIEPLMVLAGMATGDAKNFVINGADAAHRSHWNAVRGWNESSRYERRAEAAARELVVAVNGVLPWIKTHWA